MKLCYLTLMEKLEKNSLRTPINIDIAVVGNYGIGKKKLVEYWLSIPNGSGLYSKIFWIDNQAVQINIYKISPKNLHQIDIQNKIYHTIVYVSNKNINNQKSVAEWMRIMHCHSSNLTFHHIISFDTNNGIPLSINEKPLVKKSTFHQIKVDHQLSEIFSKIIAETCEVLQELPPIYNHDGNNSYEMDVFADGDNELLLMNEMDRDYIFVNKKRHDFRNNNCCTII